MSMEEPPSFQEAAQCVACHVSFTTFKRRHHCRACGRSFCNEHSTNQKALPQHGLYTLVRVCDECFNPPKFSGSNTQAPRLAAIENRPHFAKSNLRTENSPLAKEEDTTALRFEAAFTCTCGMPLCICEAPALSEVASSKVETHVAHKSREVRKMPSSSPYEMKSPIILTSGNSMPSLFFSSGKTNPGSSHPLSKSYDISGEGIREAVKNGDVSAVKELLSQGVDVNYVDKQGMSLLHLAAMFNFTEITFVLMDSGANLQALNSQGETPLDCAQTTLEHKMRQRIKFNSPK